MNTLNKTLWIQDFNVGVKTGEARGSGVLLGSLKEEIEGDEGIEEYNAAMDGIEAMLLGHACAGIDITTPDYVEGLRSAVEGCANNI